MNQKIWNLYKQSEDYKELVKIFDPDYSVYAEELFYLAEDLGGDRDAGYLMGLFNLFEGNFYSPEYDNGEDFTRKGYEDMVDNLEIRRFKQDNRGSIIFKEGDRNLLISKDDYRSKSSCIDVFSTLLYYKDSFFKPILLSTRFNIIQQNCEILGIDFPKYPKAHDYKAALMWYYDLCTVFSQFQDKYKMSDAQFCTCLYGLASILRDEEEKKPLPRPVNVWLTSASKGDVQDLEKSMDNDSFWACNENTRRGDIVVLYAVSPNSCIHSIWRADSEAVFNPFAYYQNSTRVSEGVKVSRISLQEMKDDEEFGQWKALNNNLQGLNGKKLSNSLYFALLRMIEAKGDDISKLPVPYKTEVWTPIHRASEKHVENEVLIPFLNKLGYVEGDWDRQLRMKSGRKEEREIPDFVFFPHGPKQFENAPLLIEAKWIMKSEKDRTDAFRQALSYARMLEAPIFGICDEERIIIYEKQKNGGFNYNKPAFEAHWSAVAGDADVFADLMALIGAEVIKSKIGK